jgi:hypothetical protein
MLPDLTSVDRPTGSDTCVYAPQAMDACARIERVFGTLGGVINFVSRPTGEDTRIWVATSTREAEYLPLGQPVSAITGHGRFALPVWVAFHIPGDAIDLLGTGYRLKIEVVNRASQHSLASSVIPRSVEGRRRATTAAARLRELAGLDAGRLADIFGVSRITYQNWVSGSTPQGTRGEHLLEVLALVEEAASHFGSPRATRDWLLMPVSPGGKKPVDYLAAQQYDTFRGFLLQVPTRREIVRPVGVMRRSRRPVSPQQLEDALDQLRPQMWMEDATTTPEAGSVADALPYMVKDNPR